MSAESILDMNYCDLDDKQRFSVELALQQIKKIGGLQVSFITRPDWISVYIESSVFEFFEMVDGAGNDTNEFLETCRIQGKMWHRDGTIYRTVREMVAALKGIKLDANGEVADSDEQQRREVNELKAFLLQELRTESEFEVLECCICHEPTFRSLTCRHRVCVRCVTRVEKCPLCRAELKLYVIDPSWV